MYSPLGWLSRAVMPATFALGLAAPAKAIVINDLAGLDASRMLASAFDGVTEIEFTSGVRASLCSGTLISALAVLTADHCARGFTAPQVQVNFTDSFGVTQTSRAVAGIHTFGLASVGSSLLNGSDLAILTLAAPVTDRLPFLLFDGSVIGDLARFSGYGRSGVGSTGATGDFGGARRAAETVIDAVGAAKLCGGSFSCTLNGTAEILSADFDNPQGTANTLGGSIVGSSAFMTTHEGTTAPGDSGGPLLVLRAEAWLIAGVTSGGSSPFGRYGDVAWWTSVASPAARSFVESHGGIYWREEDMTGEPADTPQPVPGPPGMLLLGTAALCLALRRRLV